MNQGLVWLADSLRVSYGEAVLQLCRMMLRAGEVYPLVAGGRAVGPLDAVAELRLSWPPWYPVTSEDRARDATTLVALVQAGQLSRETARRLLAADWGLVDVAGEQARVDQEMGDAA